MAFLKVAKDDVPKSVAAPKPDERPPLPDDAVWTAWAERAAIDLSENRMYDAIDKWKHAIDRFEGEPALFTKLHQDILDKVIVSMNEHIGVSKIIPTHLLAELDLEERLKHNELRGPVLADELFYHVKEHIDEASGPEATTLYYLCAAYSIAGTLRFSADIKEAAERCSEVARFGEYSAQKCINHKLGPYKGSVRPKYGALFITSVNDFFIILCNKLRDAAKEMTQEEISALTEYRLANPGDRLDSVVGGLKATINSVGGKISRKRTIKVLNAKLDDFVAQFRAME